MSEPGRHERSLAAPAFPGDDGSVAPVLADALASDDDLEVVAALAGVRVLVPVVATLGEHGAVSDAAGPGTPASGAAGPGTPASGDKDADMAAVLMQGADGRTALLTFSSIETLLRWNPQGRPVPVLGPDAARAALAEGATALLLDLGNPRTVVVETDDLRHLAEGHHLVRTDAGPAWVV